MLQEFHLSITPLEGDQYWIRTEDTAEGVPVAEAKVQWPVAEWLRRSQPALDDPILGLLQGRSPRTQASHENLIDLGKDLYEALFQSESIRESWHFAQGIAQNHHQFLRLRLGFRDSRLQRLPWEVLHAKGRPIATRTTLTFARYLFATLVEAQRAPRLPQGEMPLRILLVVASPDDQARLNLRQEVAHILDILRGEGGKPQAMEITVLEQPDRSTLTRALEQGSHQVLHYAGHSDFGETGGDLHLVNQHTGLTEKLSGEDLAGLLVNNNVYLAVFNSCRSGQVVGDDAEMDWRQQNLVQALVTRGVPSVIAMAERIPDEVAIAFTQLLYTNLKRGFPIDLSLSRARQGLLSAFGSDKHYWALPVLYLQPGFDGFLTERDRAQASHLDPWDTGERWPLTAAGAASPPPLKGLQADPVAPEVPTSPDALDSPEATDATLAALVAQLSQGPGAAPAPSDSSPSDGENLLPEPSLRQQLQIYDTLPTPPAPLGTLPPQEQAIPALGHATASPRRSPVAPEAPPRKGWGAWLALGLLATLGGITMATLAWQALQVAEPGPVPIPSESASGEALRQQAEAALGAGDLATAEARLLRLLDADVQAQMGDSLGVNRQVLTLVAPYEPEDLGWVAGRAHWQIYRLEVGENLAMAQSAAAIAALTGAVTAWEAVVADRPTFIEGLVALGFAYYAQGRVDQAITQWERAVAAELTQRSRQSDPATAPLQEPVVLHGYGGLMVAYADIAQQDLNPDTAARQWAIARSYREDWLRLDPERAIAPDALINAIGGRQGPAYEWLWTAPMKGRWAAVYAALENPEPPPNPLAPPP